MSPLPANTPVGAFTYLTIAAINQALAHTPALGSRADGNGTNDLEYRCRHWQSSSNIRVFDVQLGWLGNFVMCCSFPKTYRNAFLLLESLAALGGPD